MPTYSNGRFPLNLFVHRGGNIYLSPSLNARWDEAVRRGVEQYGVRLYITGDIDGLGGWNGYRPYDAQVKYRIRYGQGAAEPGKSSHGGNYRGRESFALDVANWSSLAPGNEALAWSRFVGLMTGVGLTVNFVTPKELWHVGDFNNAWVAPDFGTASGGNNSEPVSEEDDEMDLITWNGRSWLISDEKVAYVRNADASLQMAKMLSKQSKATEISNDQLTELLVLTAIPWAALDATYKGQAFDNESNWGHGTVWSRQIAEGREDMLRDASLAKSISDLEKSVTG